MPDIARPGLHGGDEPGDLAELLELAANGLPCHADALCKEYPEVSWFPERGGDTKTPAEICWRCLVRDECLEWALRQGTWLSGIWGAMSEQVRRRMRREAGQQAA